MYLVDTNVISAATPSRPASPALAEWMDAHSDSLFLSVVTVAEIEDGIAELGGERATHARAGIWPRGWEPYRTFTGNLIVVFDTLTARIAGAIADRARGQGHALGFADIMIAATAQHHGLTILSRNLKHFESLGVAVLDPFGILPTV